MHDTGAPGVDEVRRIVAIENPVIRNLEITHCYALLAAAVAARTGEGANWCTYATWASRQAGRTIRGEDLLEALGRRLGARRHLLHPFATLGRSLLRRGLYQPGTRLGRLTSQLHTPFDAFERASDAVARGNLRVFDEIGHEFARYLRECPPDAEPDGPELRRFLEGLREGAPPEGQGYLRNAFVRYDRQRVEDDPKARAELVFLANLEIGLHEQTRLQPEIRAALDAASATGEDLGRRVLAALFPRAVRFVPGPAIRLAGAAAGRFQSVSNALAREVITECLMVLALPGRVLALGRHLEDRFAPPLREPSNADLIALLGRYEPVAPDRDDCGAREWSDLRQRMHYIVHLFRVFHGDNGLGRAPFTPEQVASFQRGVVPDGDL
jgi:hypothetical protein